MIRKRVRNLVDAAGIPGFHVPSFSSRTLVYKGLLLAYQVKKFYSDLADPAIESGLALVHQRYSTNTWPTWDLAHPYRYLAHNGEINTVQGNRYWMTAREAVIRSGVWGDDIHKIFPLIAEGGSDSAMLDSALEFLVLSGRDLAHAMMMLIPEAWDRDPLMRDEKKAFYQYHQSMMEPWDGPASIACTDGTRIAGVLDRNGLRPSRYWVTKDGFVVLSSECGVLPINPEDVKYKGRLQPGRMLLIDTAEGRIIPDDEIKLYYARRQPYRQWLDENLTKLEDLPVRSASSAGDGETDRHTRQQLFGYSLEDLRILLAPMAATGIEAQGSMGNDTPIAALSDRPQLRFTYFKQIFAQVTNPPIDSIKEESVM
ncbi:MAG: glutamate synthase central domain-containing protein, partial [Myxococcota bacterium]